MRTSNVPPEHLGSDAHPPAAEWARECMGWRGHQDWWSEQHTVAKPDVGANGVGILPIEHTKRDGRSAASHSDQDDERVY
jgi:hypothetical protein